jgi:hypothetical protein
MGYFSFFILCTVLKCSFWWAVLLMHKPVAAQAVTCAPPVIGAAAQYWFVNQ